MKLKIIIIVATITTLLFACAEEKKATETALLFEGGDSAFVFKEVRTLLSEKALLKVKLEAPTQIQYNNQNQLFPDGIYLELFDRKGQKTTTLEGDWAEYNHKTDEFIATGNVIVKNLIEKQQLETPVLHWDKKQQQIHSDTTIKITTKNEQIMGVGMSAKQDFSQYIIKEPTGIITLPEDFVPSPEPKKEYFVMPDVKKKKLNLTLKEKRKMSGDKKLKPFIKKQGF